MKLQIIATYFRPFREAVWRQKEPYSVATLLRARRDWNCDIWLSAAKLGCEVSVVLANDVPTQIEWVQANAGSLPERLVAECEPVLCGRKFDEPGALSWTADERRLANEIVRHQIEAEAAGSVLFTNPFFPDGAFRREMQRKGVFTTAMSTQPMPDLSVLEGCDLLLTVCPVVAARYRAAGLRAAVFRYGFNAAVLELAGHEPRENTVVFVGQIGPSHHRRREFLDQVAQAVPLAWYGLQSDCEFAPEALLSAWRGEAFGIDMYRALARGSVGLNFPPDFAPWLFGMFRTYEVIGAGLPLLMPETVEGDSVLRKSEHWFAFSDAKDAVTLCRDLLECPERARTIGARGQRMVLEHRRSDEAVGEMLQSIEEHRAAVR